MKKGEKLLKLPVTDEVEEKITQKQQDLYNDAVTEIKEIIIKALNIKYKDITKEWADDGNELTIFTKDGQEYKLNINILQGYIQIFKVDEEEEEEVVLNIYL